MSIGQVSWHSVIESETTSTLPLREARVWVRPVESRRARCAMAACIGPSSRVPMEAPGAFGPECAAAEVAPPQPESSRAPASRAVSTASGRRTREVDFVIGADVIPAPKGAARRLRNVAQRADPAKPGAGAGTRRERRRCSVGSPRGGA